MKHINAKTTFIVENSLFLIIEDYNEFKSINSINDYDISLQIKKVQGHTVPMYFYILLQDKKEKKKYKINIKLNERILERFSFYLDFAENVVFTDATTGRMTKPFKINTFLKKKWQESIKALQEVYFLKKMLRNI